MQSSKACSSTSSSKSKRNSKDQEKRKSQSQSAANPTESNKSSPSKESKGYVGITADSIRHFDGESCKVSDVAFDALAEDINYKLRYIIHNSLIQARLLGRNSITSDDVDEVFDNLNIEKIYGATANPNWIQFEDQNLHHLALDEIKVNLIELAEEDNVYGQEADIILEATWYSDVNMNINDRQNCFREYFTTLCQAFVSDDYELKRAALQDISENSSIGPITNWFYHFVYLLMTRYNAYDDLTLKALELLEVLENSPLPSVNVPVKQLKLLVHVMLQRLFILKTTRGIIKPICSVLALLCMREPLKEMVLIRVNQELILKCEQNVLPLLNVIYFLGIDAVKRIFLPNATYFLTVLMQQEDWDLRDIILSIYGLICKSRIYDEYLLSSFNSALGIVLVPYWLPMKIKQVEDQKMQIDFVNMKTQLLKKRRKINCPFRKVQHQPLEEVFEIPFDNCPIKRKLELHKRPMLNLKRETYIIVGKTTLLLSILKPPKFYSKCYDHSLLTHHI